MVPTVFPGLCRNPWQAVCNDHLHVYAKNARINTPERQLAMLSELAELNWHVVCFSETRAKDQDVLLHGGHRLITNLGSSPSSSASGVGILIHCQHVGSILRTIPVSDRVLGVDIRLDDQSYRIIAVYLPHAGYPWVDFTECFDMISSLLHPKKDPVEPLWAVGCRLHLERP